jgi:hypothetical protein
VHAENSVALEGQRYAAAAQHALAIPSAYHDALTPHRYAAAAQHALQYAGPPPRDTTYVGLHAPPPEALGLRLSKAGVVTGVFEALEVYESIRAHTWQARASRLLA